MPRAARALVVTAALALGGCSPAPSAEPTEARVATTEAPATSAPPPPAAPPAAPPAGAVPARVVIGDIALDAPLIGLGIGPDGSMEVPVDYDEVGWFTGGGRPGGHGPLVIAAHVDSPTGPAAFIRLDEVQVDDIVEVTDIDGVTHRYIVTETADYPKASFPTARVFGATATDELRLITCGGVFDAAARSYVDNRVVYAVRADA